MKALAFTIALVVLHITAKAHESSDYQTIGIHQSIIDHENPNFEPWRINAPMPILDFDILVFPNPTSQFAQIQIDGFGPIDLRYEILNLFGQVVNHGLITSHRTLIDLSELEYSTYILNIFDSENRFIRSMQIVKEY